MKDHPENIQSNGGGEAAGVIEKKYRLREDLTFSKLLEYLPPMIATNISTLLLITVDGIVAGNLVGEDALSAISLFGPVNTLIGAITVVIATGASAVLSNRIGEVDTVRVLQAKKTVKILSVLTAVLVSLIQIPATLGIIASYNLSESMMSLVTAYSIGIMLSNPFGLISTIGVYELQIMGRMKVLMRLALFEGIINLILDILFTGVFHLGVAGTGYGTAVACTLRCIVTVIYLYKETDIYKTGNAKIVFSDIAEIVSKGLPECASMLVGVMQNYIIIRIILLSFGSGGGTIKGVCTFCYSLANVLMSSVQGALRPMIGLFNGAENRQGVRSLMKQGVVMVSLLSGFMIILYEAVPALFYRIHGVRTTPVWGEESLRLFALSIGIQGINTLFRLFYTTRGLQRFSTVLTLIGNCAMPLSAYYLSSNFEPPFVFLSYLVAAVIILFANVIRYVMLRLNDMKKEKSNNRRIYLTVKPEDAIDASKMVQEYAIENGYSLELANRARLCMEEMVAYSVQSSRNRIVRNQIMFSFDDDNVIFTMLDDGACIIFDEDEEKQRMITDNYALLKRVSRSMKYQYILNLNHTMLKFSTGE